MNTHPKYAKHTPALPTTHTPYTHSRTDKTHTKCTNIHYRGRHTTRSAMPNTVVCRLPKIPVHKLSCKRGSKSRGPSGARCTTYIFATSPQHATHRRQANKAASQSMPQGRYLAHQQQLATDAQGTSKDIASGYNNPQLACRECC